ncbi:MAG: cysteine desulfurase [Candidatus Aenigmarchaeota archaeon]|nr:cysteine desulfurase [Candidatus Aenigmarchaeota archaeon]
MKGLDVGKIMADFPILNRVVNGKPLAYLDNSATSQKPLQVMEAISHYYAHSNSNIHRGVHQLSAESTAAYEEAHSKAAAFIGASSMEEIVFTKNTTESINLLAYGLGSRLGKGDEIVVTQMEHHSNLVPWQQAAKRAGATLKFIEIDQKGELKMESIEGSITKKTRVVSVVHASNALGTVNDIRMIGEVAHENGSVFIVDGAQSVPHMPVDVKAIGCDFLAFSGHKMLGPTGTGVLFGRRDMLEETEPFIFGGDMIREVSFGESRWNALPWKFEAGTPNISGGIGLGAAIDYLQGIGMEKIEEQEKSLTSYAFKQLETIKGLKIYGPPPEKRIGVISFNISGVHAHDVAEILNGEGIAIRGGHHCAMPLMHLLGVAGSARASFYLYNTREEVDRLAAALEKVKKIFSV